ncbi:uncharacterized protein BP5553_09549 [Venustampulla echinocandica]|uniref:Heterokaryon incompatibility domain-containing protein n=1 Tax=Venustampulla echinocandica TaxID=2656787 RepID=A0A370TBC0_9HELO|nr:uncharacterized protein BP5553_09549 [Venustampulla echinocandica]RDL31340.1 hypothetical protein BP5553_09549 [Venustampulla echinocandica]
MDMDGARAGDLGLDPAPDLCYAPTALSPVGGHDISPILYSPLNEDDDEIRLISFPPQPQSGGSDSEFIHCNLETVSLKSATLDYQNLVSGLILAREGNNRKVIGEWVRVQSQLKSGNEHAADTLKYHVPPRVCHRYTWGDYAALSYAWGNPDPDTMRKIIINGQAMSVGPNLEGALRALSASPDFDFDSGYKLWIDALCINQKDFDERSRQISKMQNIYGDSWAVITWLGEEADESDKAFDLVRSLSIASVKGRGQQVLAELQQDPSCLGNESWLALHQLMQRPYWSRLWVIQEIVLGSSAVLLRCGSQAIGWPSFCIGIGFLFDYLWTIKDWLLKREIYLRAVEKRFAPVWSTANLHLVKQDLWPLSQREEQGRANLSFGRLLVLGNSAESTDIRDKVYGLVGIMDLEIAKHLVADYKSAPCIIFAKVARIFIQSYQNLDPIREGNPWGQTDTPSWAADWTWGGRVRHSRPETRLYGPFWNRDGPPRLANEAIPYSASQKSRAEASFSDDGLHLTCRGFVVDRIAGLTARGYGYFSWSMASIVQPNPANSVYGGPVETARALCHALVADRIADGSKANDRQMAILSLPSTFQIAAPQFEKLKWKWLSTQEGYYFRWEQWRLANKDFLLGDRRLGEYFTDFLPFGASEYDYTEVYSCFDRTSKGRRLITTENGYLGWAPDNMYGSDYDQAKKGDLIAIIFGCSTPIAIRPRGDLFQVIGEAYVQGLMDGEAMDFLNLGGFSVQDFTFC